MKHKGSYKIIHIYSRNYDTWFPEVGSDDYFLAGWAGLQAKNLARYDPDTRQEAWRLERDTNRIVYKTVNNVVCKLIPFRGRGLVKGYSRLLIREIKREAKENRIIVNIHELHNLPTFILTWKLRLIPVVAHHHGSMPYGLRKMKFPKLLFKPVLTFLDKRMLKRVDHFSVISVVEKEYLQRNTDADKVTLEQGRIFFADWPLIRKNEAREKMQIAPEKKVIIYVGYLYKLKGVDLLLKAFCELRQKYNLHMITIGGNKQDELYNDAVQAGVQNFSRIPNNEMKWYLSCADVYCAPALDGIWVNYGGTSTAVIEAMACNIPVITKQLIHFPDDSWKKVGIIPNSYSDIIKGLEEIFAQPEKFKPREVAMHHYDFETILKKNLEMYHSLFRDYYSH